MNTSIIKTLSFCLFVLFIGGCSTFHEVKPNEQGSFVSLAEQVKVRDYVIVTMKDDTRHKFRIEQITDTQLVGKDVSVEIADIKELTIKEAEVAKTLTNVGVTWAILSLIIIACCFVPG
ncbi:hypothetical protein E2K93_16185 [Thalassotalea sp. HSM 43]|uniref:hypothetical protein n=1 Tax=Thalassotalea sp. HSM 43 TaxID=2552945 RepID=UPI001080C885|nr:hypothetical protein [Thalassotalea sp. HSM 43]QBY05806.1 hypothetical protein E2K93_16185 [Thalassotalea sp. HSM 43]